MFGISQCSRRCQSGDSRAPRGAYNQDMDDSGAWRVPIEEVLDLHPFQPSDVCDVAREYLQQARAKGFRQVRLIHGRGKGVQREAIRRMLSAMEIVADFHDADPGGGGWGATVVQLRE